MYKKISKKQQRKNNYFKEHLVKKRKRPVEIQISEFNLVSKIRAKKKSILYSNLSIRKKSIQGI